MDIGRATTSSADTASTREAGPVSRLVSSLTGLHVQRNKAIVGENAFAHEAGIHQDGMLKDAPPTKSWGPRMSAGPRADVLGKHSGRHAYKMRRGLGLPLTAEQ